MTQICVITAISKPESYQPAEKTPLKVYHSKNTIKTKQNFILCK